MSLCPAENQRLEIGEVSRRIFLDFVLRHAPSAEIGRVGTVGILGKPGFPNPPVLGVPIGAIEIDDASRGGIRTAWKYAHPSAVNRLNLECAWCKRSGKQGPLLCTSLSGARLPQAVGADNAAAVSS